ncbi:hypothetical protein EDD29_7358 [Actinocorallia herbida]|uniref:DNA-binding protein n=1 Tax=Actinocorallia herbida TaxID=58109 RepID=A0A3N1D7Y6_9ACTN|nr:DNA-binding protein [Actinocorallia herbida]ROO89653.1 hypothetical protein EDD29_7358 [Actinocorallia herbida]
MMTAVPTAPETAADLLAAGAYLHPETGDPGAGVPVTARAYRRAGLAGRTVVRLVPEEIGEAEDSAAAFLGMTRAGSADVVGFGARERLSFPGWVLVHHPGDGHHALALVPEIDRLARLAVAKPQAALDGFNGLGTRMAVSVPHLLPTFYERAAREFLAAERPDHAARMFTAARKAEIEHGLPIDQDRVDDVFVEFALAGVLPAKTLSEYSKELALRLSPDEALGRFVRLAVRRTSGGLPPASTMAADLRRLAKAASGDAGRIERDYLAEILTYPVTALASESWWKAHKAAVVALCAERPEIRGALLRIMPEIEEAGFADLWLDLLERTGAVTPLVEGAAPEDGATGWLGRFLKARGRSRSAANRLVALESVVTRMAGRLKAEIAEQGTPLPAPAGADLLDLLLELGVPVADPAPGHRVNLAPWAGGADRRDLAVLCADPRFAPALLQGLGMVGQTDTPRQQVFATTLPLRPHLLAYVDRCTARVAEAGLPTLHQALNGVRVLAPSTTRIAEAAVRTALAVDLPELLARTLRGGLFDELSWPALEDALAELFPEGFTNGAPRIAEEWPYLVVAGPTRALVLDGSGAVLDHALRLPQGVHDFGFRYVDGALLVHWSLGEQRSGYWHPRPDRVVPLDGTGMNRSRLVNHWSTGQQISLEVRGGGRATGTAVIHHGDTLAPGGTEIVSDGEKYWALHADESGAVVWHAFDPGAGEIGEPDLPAFFAEPGESFRHGFLAPFPGTGMTPVGAVVGGVFGRRTVTLPDGTVRGEDLAGNASPAVTGYENVWPLRLPGDDRARALVRSGAGNKATYRLIGPDGLVLGDTFLTSRYRAGSRATPPPHYWAHLRPRDERGSAALRRADRALAVRLLDGPEEETADRVRALLPEIGHPGLREGVTALVQGVSRDRAELAGIVAGIELKLSPVGAAERPAAPTDGALYRAIDGLNDDPNGWRGEHTTESAHLLWRLGRLRAGAERPSQDGTAPQVELPQQILDLPHIVEGLSALVLRAVSGITPEPGRTALRALLDRLGEAGMADAEPDAWRVFRLRAPNPTGSYVNHRRGHQLGGGAFFAVVDQGRAHRNRPQEVTAVFHDPSGGFEVPEGHEIVEELPFVEGRPDVPVTEVLALLDARGPAPWRAESVAEFARLTGVTPTTAALVVSGLLGLSGSHASSLPAEMRKTLRLKAAEVDAAQPDLGRLPGKVRRALVGALLPADPARLWTHGPDVAAAAEVWNRAVPRKIAVPEALLAEADKAFGGRSQTQNHLRGVLEPSACSPLSRDVEFTVAAYGFEAVEKGGFTSGTLLPAVGMLAWLAHRLPAGDPLRALLPAGLAAVRDRLAHPGLVLNALKRVAADFEKAAGTPDEVGDGWARYGAILIKPGDVHHRPGVKVAHLDADSDDPRLVLLRGSLGHLMGFEVALRTARDARFAALLDDPGEPVEGGRSKDGTWYPQDPTRSVPDLVEEAAKAHGSSADAAAVYLMLLAMPDPTDRHTARWTGWKPARLKEARAELAATELVVEARRTRAGRTLFLPCPWTEARSPQVPMEDWKQALYPLANGGTAPLTTVVPTEPVADVYRHAWRRITEGDLPRFGELEIPRQTRRR